MPKWTILHLVRYPPFDDKRLHAEEVPIFEKIIETNVRDEELQDKLPPYKIMSEEGWMIERKIINANGEDFEQSTACKRIPVHLCNSLKNGEKAGISFLIDCMDMPDK